jgi:hypothetical protein
MRTCVDCGNEFEQTQGGRPRKKCYDCSPLRPNQDWRKYDKRKKQNNLAPTPSSVGAERAAPPARGVNQAPGGTAPQCEPSGPGVKCAWCHAYTPNGLPFCNPHHRAMFAEKVAREQARKKIRHTSNKGHTGMTYKKRPIEMVRENKEREYA